MFSLCFIDVEMKDPFPSEVVPPVWLLVLGWTPKEPSTHHLTIFVESALKIRGGVSVARKYLIKCASLVQSSSSGKITLVVRNATVVWISGQACLVANYIRDIVTDFKQYEPSNKNVRTPAANHLFKVR